MAFKHFKHLNVPDSWERYWTKYPQGMTILEALFEWVSQVDSMVDNQNKLNDNVEQFRNEIDAFVARFDNRLQTEVTQTLNDWQNSGFLDVVISEALQWELDTYVTTNEADKLSLTAQLQQTKQELNAQLTKKVYKVATVSDMLAHSAVNGDIFEIANGKKYTITNDSKLVDDGKYVKILSNGLKAVDHKLNEDFKQNGLRGIAITVTSNADNYHLTQVNAQIPLAVELGTHVQLAVGVNFGDSTNSSGNIALCVTTAQLQACIDLIVNAGLVIDMIKLHSQGASGDWAGYDIVPVSTTNFFTKYKSIIHDVGALCNANTIPILTMCNEQVTTVANTYYPQWLDITNTLRALYPTLKLSIAFFPSTMVTCLTEYKLKYTNSVFQLLDYVSLNVYPAVLRKNEKYPYDYNAYDNGLNKPIDDTYIYKHMSVLELIDEIKRVKPVLITETGCISYDTNTLINYFYAINDPLYRTGTEGKDQKEYYEEVLPALMNLTSGVYIWSSAAPFTPKNEGLVYLNNKLRTVL